MQELLATLGRYDLVFGRLLSPRAPWSLYLSLEEIPDLEAFRSEVLSLVGPRAKVHGPFGAVSLVGFGLGSRPRALLDTAIYLDGCDIEALDSWTTRGALTFVVGLGDVPKALLALHRGFISSQCRAAPSSLSA